jgi:membrane associated rhomboid family serine protease
MVIPLYDHNPFRLPVPPYVTFGLIIVNVGIFLIQVAVGDAANAAIISTFGAIPSQIARTAPHIGWIAADSTLLTCMFLHEGWQHIFFNMLFLFVFGDDIEEALGRWRFLAFYLLSGVAGSLAYVSVNAHSDLPLIGASGAISGVLGAYMLIRPCAKVAVFFWFLVFRVPAWMVIGLFVLTQIVHLAGTDNDGVAYMAHVGGLTAGVLLFLILRPRHVPLFECIWDPEKSMPPPPTA